MEGGGLVEEWRCVDRSIDGRVGLVMNADVSRRNREVMRAMRRMERGIMAGAE